MDVACQVCGCREMSDYVKHDDGHYLRCDQCGLVLNADADRLAAEATQHYDDASYFSGYTSRFERKVLAARRRLDLVQSFAATGRLLDIGCGTGETLVAARNAGFEPEGLDIGAFPAERGVELGFVVHQASVTDTRLPDASFDVVTMWDVLEHIPRTVEGLREAVRVLRPGGYAAMMVPNGEYLKSHLLRSKYQNYRGLWARTHFVYHTPHTFDRVVRDVGLRPCRIPLIRGGALNRGLLPAIGEVLVGLPRYLVWHIRGACHMSRNIFVVARKPS